MEWTRRSRVWVGLCALWVGPALFSAAACGGSSNADLGGPTSGDGGASQDDSSSSGDGATGSMDGGGASEAGVDASVKGSGGKGGGPPASDAAVYTIGGTISGLTADVVLLLNGGDSLTVSADGSFTFSQGLPSGSAYDVTVGTQPLGETCTVTGGAGTVGTAAVTSVSIQCAPRDYSIGGNATGVGSGNGGTLVLQNNGGDTLTISSSGSYQFAQALPHGAAYDVTVLVPPAGKSCTVSNAAGTVGYANVTNVDVLCH